MPIIKYPGADNLPVVAGRLTALQAMTSEQHDALCAVYEHVKTHSFVNRLVRGSELAVDTDSLDALVLMDCLESHMDGGGKVHYRLTREALWYLKSAYTWTYSDPKTRLESSTLLNQMQSFDDDMSALMLEDHHMRTDMDLLGTTRVYRVEDRAYELTVFEQDALLLVAKRYATAESNKLFMCDFGNSWQVNQLAALERHTLAVQAKPPRRGYQLTGDGLYVAGLMHNVTVDLLTDIILAPHPSPNVAAVTLSELCASLGAYEAVSLDDYLLATYKQAWENLAALWERKTGTWNLPLETGYNASRYAAQFQALRDSNENEVSGGWFEHFKDSISETVDVVSLPAWEVLATAVLKEKLERYSLEIRVVEEK